MPRRRMIYPELWEDEHFGSLSDRARILFIACIGNADDDGRLIASLPNLRAIGFRYSDIKLSEIKVIRDELSLKMVNFKIYGHNGSTYLQLCKWEEYQTIRSDRKTPSKLPSARQFANSCQTNDGQDAAQINKEINKEEVSAPSKRFQKPTMDELIAYCRERTIVYVKPSIFYNHYESNGWRVGKNSMKDWRAALRNWNTREKEKGGNSGETKYRKL